MSYDKYIISEFISDDGRRVASILGEEGAAKIVLILSDAFDSNVRTYSGARLSMIEGVAEDFTLGSDIGSREGNTFRVGL
jgi:hypothetical protein